MASEDYGARFFGVVDQFLEELGWLSEQWVPLAGIPQVPLVGTDVTPRYDLLRPSR